MWPLQGTVQCCTMKSGRESQTRTEQCPFIEELALIAQSLGINMDILEKKKSSRYSEQIASPGPGLAFVLKVKRGLIVLKLVSLYSGLVLFS